MKPTIQILGTTWTLSRGSHTEDDLRCFGETDTHDRSIALFTRPHEDYPTRGPVEQTLLHEVLHAILHVSGTSNLLPGGTEEAVVTALEHGLWPLMQSGLFKPKGGR